MAEVLRTHTDSKPILAQGSHWQQVGDVEQSCLTSANSGTFVSATILPRRPSLLLRLESTLASVMAKPWAFLPFGRCARVIK